MRCGSVVVTVLCVVVVVEANELAVLPYTCFRVISKELISLICGDVARLIEELMGPGGRKCSSMKTRHGGGSGMCQKIDNFGCLWTGFILLKIANSSLRDGAILIC